MEGEIIKRVLRYASNHSYSAILIFIVFTSELFSFTSMFQITFPVQIHVDNYYMHTPTSRSKKGRYGYNRMYSEFSYVYQEWERRLSHWRLSFYYKKRGFKALYTDAIDKSRENGLRKNGPPKMCMECSDVINLWKPKTRQQTFLGSFSVLQFRACWIVKWTSNIFFCV